MKGTFMKEISGDIILFKYTKSCSVCSLLIRSGVNPPLKVWEVLIDYSLTSDNATYLDLALKYDIPFVPSFHASLLRIPIKYFS